jgi:hypothetical protein
VLGWLPDLDAWAQVIAHFLKPGGFFYLREFHPFADIMDDRSPVRMPTPHYPYFHSAEPFECGPDSGSYADRNSPVRVHHYEWAHSFSDIINSLITAGLRLEFLHEFPFTTYQSHPFLTQGDDGHWRYVEATESLPLMFSLKAIMPRT